MMSEPLLERIMGRHQWRGRRRGFRRGGGSADFISLGVIAKTFPLAKVHDVLAETGKASVRQRELPAHVMVYYVIALALYMEASCREVLRFLLEGLLWLEGCPKSIEPTGIIGHFSSAHTARRRSRSAVCMM